MNWVFKMVLFKCEILKDIFLLFFLGVKIGVFGLNGVGKLILFCIMVGVDKDFFGEVCV